MSQSTDRTELVQALRALASLDAHIVLRLCTDEQPVVDFYGDIDAEVELSLEVLDERPLTRGEIYLLLQYLLRRSADDDILPRDPEEFCSEVERRLAMDYPGKLGFNPLTKAMEPP